ncbi:MAG: hypothetical protein PHY59_02080 [Methanobacterium sp.]|nr:hypothetical protein [Methanobacterium sp.]
MIKTKIMALVVFFIFLAGTMGATTVFAVDIVGFRNVDYKNGDILKVN